MGQCRLCLQDSVNLQNSHFLPAGIYRILRDKSEKNPNPWLITSQNALQTSQQMTAPLLCSDCEQRLSKNGERWVLRNCLKRNGSFPLAKILTSRIPDVPSSTSPTKLYFASNIPEINVSAIAYFAASVFWRGSIHHWNTDGTIPVSLGRFQEKFRHYLLGTAAFPDNCRLSVVVRERCTIDRLASPPSGGTIGNFQIYRFPMPGLAFGIAIGEAFPPESLTTCFVHSPGNPLALTDKIEGFLMEAVTRIRKQSLK